jgi:hypothetical protein
MGVRDIYDTNGSAAISIKEPLAVLVSLFNILKYPLYSVTFFTVKRKNNVLDLGQLNN